MRSWEPDRQETMSINALFGGTYNVLGRSLDIAQKRHELIAGNVANLDTKGYQAKDLDFNKALKDAMSGNMIDLAKTDERHFGKQGGRYSVSEEAYSLGDSDRVDIDREMTKLAENNLRYQTGVESLLRKFAMLKQAISEGGR